MITDGCNTPKNTDQFNVRFERAKFFDKVKKDFCFPALNELQNENYADIDLPDLHMNLLELEQTPFDPSFFVKFLNFRLEVFSECWVLFSKTHSFILYLDGEELWRQDFKNNGKCIVDDGNKDFVPYIMYLQNYIEDKLIERDSIIKEESKTEKLWRNIKRLECVDHKSKENK